MIQAIAETKSLADILRARILRDGPLTFRDWMNAALYDPIYGYYRRNAQQIWGRRGDYRTSPERSELFAATFARYFATVYRELETPAHFTIVEIGGGEGQFALGVLQTLRSYFPEVFAATHYIFDEIGEVANLAARDRLAEFIGRVSFESTGELEIECGVVFTNELLDAFPVHRVTMLDGEPGEYSVDIDEQEQFVWKLGALSRPEIATYLTANDIELARGNIAEINLEIEPWLAKIAQYLKRGRVITVDYGAESSELYSTERATGTLRGFKQQRFVENVLATPGDHDLTSTINWSAVKRAGEIVGLKTITFERLDKFLIEHGLLKQLELVSENLPDSSRLKLSSTAREMILPDGMAASFQVLVQQKTSATASDRNA